MFRILFILMFCMMSLRAIELAKIQSLSADFKQTTIQQDEKIIYSGKIYAKSPNHAKWIYTAPLQKEVFINDNRVIVYEPRLFQATYYQSDKNLDILQILRLAKESETQNSAVVQKEEPSTFAKPKKEESVITHIQNEAGDIIINETQDIGAFQDKDSLAKEPIKVQDVKKLYHINFDNVNYEIIMLNAMPSQIKFIDEFGNTIEIDLSNVVINGKIDNDLFIFKPTNDIDLIRQ
ncbi:MAG: outer-membrane lipoprotein carrier protein LolA [Helicobacter sp.]|nr:outer-membrane lipoprotein carrier protein LolA [Helicobacter sp.]